MDYEIKSLYCKKNEKDDIYKFKPFNINSQIIISSKYKNISFNIQKKDIDKILIRYNDKTITKEDNDLYFNLDTDVVTINIIGCKDNPRIYLYNFFVNKLPKNYKISVITLVRNTHELLKSAIKSLISQSNPNWENIIINDGSKEKVLIEDIIESDKISRFKDRIKIINLDSWKGLIKCHKIGIMHARNEIIGILDSDDTLEPDAVDSILNVYNQNDDNIFLYSNFNICGPNMELLGKGWASSVGDTTLLNKRRGNHFRTFPRKYYYLTSGYDNDLVYGAEDQDILFKIEKYCKPIYLDKYLYNYRTNQLTGSISSMKKASRYSLNLSILKNIYDRYGDIDFYIEIYSDLSDEEKSKTKKYLDRVEKYVKPYHYNGNNFYVELKSNDITISTLLGEQTHKYIDEYLKNLQNVYKVDVKWDYINSCFQLVDNLKFDLEKFRLIHPNTYFDNIYIINLKKDVEKKERIRSIFSKYNIKCEFFEAVYGKEVPDLEKYHKENTTLKSPGQYGYSLSMIKIFEDAIQKKYKKILVCDDDIILKKNFLYEFDVNIKSIPYDWKVLFMGLSGPWSFHEKIFLYNHDLNLNYTTNLIGCDGSFCVGYDSLIFKDIIRITKEFMYPYDTQLIEYLNSNLQIDKYAFYPHLVIADTVKKSEIVNYQEEMSLWKNIERNHLKFMINLNEYELETMHENQYKELEII